MVNDSVHSFLSYLSFQKRFSPLTIQSYATDLHKFFLFLDENGDTYTLQTISQQEVRSFVAGQISQGFSPVSVNRAVSALRSFFKFLLKEGTVSHNPALRVIRLKTPKRLPVFIDEKQMDAVFTSLSFSTGFNGLRDQLIMDVLYQTGIRRAELLSLKESDLDLYRLELKVLGKRNKERIIPFDIALKRNLEAYLLVKKEQQLSNPFLMVTEKNTALSAAQLTAIVRRILSGVTTSKKKSPHVLRHTFATHILNNGADINAVKELLGHASLAATQVYTHNTIDKLKKMYNQAHPRSGN